MLKNYMEDVVDHFLPDILNQYRDICTCSKCIDDIKAIALNNLKPLYFTSEVGNVYNKLNEMEAQFGADILKELTKAAEMVSEKPRHRGHSNPDTPNTPIGL